jgi:hypothetical protein
MLGYLSLKAYGGNQDVAGLRDDPEWLQKVANVNPYDGKRYEPLPAWELQDPDQPHERGDIELQIVGLGPDTKWGRVN